MVDESIKAQYDELIKALKNAEENSLIDKISIEDGKIFYSIDFDTTEDEEPHDVAWEELCSVSEVLRSIGFEHYDTGSDNDTTWGCIKKKVGDPNSCLFCYAGNASKVRDIYLCSNCKLLTEINFLGIRRGQNVNINEVWITFVEPANEKCDPQYIYMSAKTAVQIQKERKDIPAYKDDLSALYDYMVIHWASFCEAPPKICLVETNEVEERLHDTFILEWLMKKGPDNVIQADSATLMSGKGPFITMHLPGVKPSPVTGSFDWREIIKAQMRKDGK